MFAAIVVNHIQSGCSLGCDHKNPSSPPRSGSQIVKHTASPLVAETLAIRWGLSTTVALEIPDISIHSDCSTFIQAINHKQQIKEAFRILKDIDHLSSAFVSLSFSHIPRLQNRDADLLAKQALRAHQSSHLSTPFMG